MPVIKLSIKDLHLEKSGHQILRGLTLDINESEILTIIGKSGSGKSSFLRCLNRLDEPTSGEIYYNQQEIRTIPVTQLRSRIGMVFQKPVPLDGTVAENIAYGPALNQRYLSPQQIQELLISVHLTPDFSNRPANELSGGQEQRLCIARALANQPDILLLDEPTSALDPIATRQIENTLLELKQSLSLTMLWVSHSIDQIRRVADRVLLIDEGRCLRLGTCDEILNPENGDALALAFERGEPQTEGVS
ncbi:phosphate ABC transporter ATP-binding protein [Anaerolineales bacterium]